MKHECESTPPVSRSRIRTGLILVLAAVTAYTALFFYLQVRLYDGLHMTIHDIIMSNQPLHNMLHGRWFETSYASSLWWNGGEPHSLFEHHLYVILALLLPLYALFPTVHTIFLVQAFGVGIGALAVYLIAGHISQSEHVSTCLGISYLLYPTIQGMTLNHWRFGFHPDTLFPALLLFAFYFSLKNRTGLTWLFVIAALLCAEHVSLTVGAFGLYLLLTRRGQRLRGLSIAAAAAVWVALAVLVIIPHFRGMPPRYVLDVLNARDEAHLDLLPALSLMALYAKYLFIPLAFTFLLDIPALLLALPGLLLNVSARYVGYDPGYIPFSWRMAQLAPFLFLGAVLGVSKLSAHPARGRFSRRGAHVLATLILLGTLSSSLVMGPLSPVYVVEAKRYRGLSASEAGALQEVKARIDPEDSLSADAYWGSQFTSRRLIHTFPIRWRQDDKVLVVARADPFPRRPDHLAVIEYLRNSSIHRLLYREGDVELYERTPPPQQTAYSIAFANRIRLTGFTLETPRVQPGAQVVLHLFWATEAALDEDYVVFVQLVDEGGRKIAQSDSIPMQGMYPTSEWLAGETVIDTHVLEVGEDAPAGRYRLLLGLYSEVTHDCVPITMGDAEQQETAAPLAAVEVSSR